MSEQDVAPQGAGAGESVGTIVAPQRPDAGEPIGTLAALSAPVIGVPDDPRTGEPRIPWTVRVASALCYVGVANVVGALLWVYWSAVPKEGFADASWLMGQFVTEPGSLGRVLLAVAVTVITLLIAVPVAITGYYAWTGYRWTRISALVGAALSFGALTLNVYAWPTILWTAAAAVLLWTPPTARYFVAWWARRHPEQHFAPPTTNVYYGPLPRYRRD
ncbi:MAG: hypothetical protein QM779_10885 [Propionicimonas sp.]|uniref:hypothetical protein n=1 Tax=Propionicimonas sp. TaxID=1955623 RepID=UPI003D0A505A